METPTKTQQDTHTGIVMCRYATFITEVRDHINMPMSAYAL